MGFAVEQMVAVRADPTWIGVVAEVLPLVGGGLCYRVYHDLGDARTYREDQLTSLSRVDEPYGRGATFGAFRMRLRGYLDTLRDAPPPGATHPLATLHIRALERGGGRMVRANLMVADPDVSAGDYLFGVDVWQVTAAQTAFHVIPVAVELATGAPAERVEQQLLPMLVRADGRPDGPAAAVIESARSALERRAEQHRQRAETAAAPTSHALTARRLTRLAAHHERHRRLLTERLATSDPASVAAASQVRDRAEQIYQLRRDALEQLRQPSIASHRIAEGVLTVTNPTNARN